jgi:hypothetical protein
VGYITQLQTSTCPTPYAQPVWGDWIETQNSCEKSAINPTNMSSPISPASPINPDNMPVPVTPQESATAQQENVQTMTEANVLPAPKTESSTATTAPAASAGTTETTSAQPAQAPSVPKGRELVPGFGLVMSLEVLNGPIIQQEQTLNTLLEYQQELPYELRGNQGVLLEFIVDSQANTYFDNRGRWESNLLRGYVFQRLQSFD